MKLVASLGLLAVGAVNGDIKLDGLKELNLDMIGKGFDLGGKLGDLFGGKDAKDDKLGKKAPVCSDFFPTATECGAAIVEGWVPITDSDSIECVVDKDTKMCNPKVCCDPTCATVSNDTCAAWAPRAGFFQARGAEELCCAPDRETQLCEPSDRCCAPGEMDGQNILDTFPETCASFQRGFGFRLREFRQENPNAEQSLYLFRGTAEAPTSSGATERIGYSPPFEDSYPAPVDINTTYTVAIDPATGLSTPTFTSSFTGGNNVFMFTDNDVPITEAQNGSPPIETDFNACELAVRVAGGGSGTDNPLITLNKIEVIQNGITQDFLAATGVTPGTEVTEGVTFYNFERFLTPTLDQTRSYAWQVNFTLSGRFRASTEGSRMQFSCGRCLPPAP